ncbi:MAG: MATE family efflux transporter [Ruminococcaceae bacterium]|nr:MATE family efflux transporter [Oscillospiraceae bacterium]
MRKVDATQGKLVKLIFVYTIPLILTTLVQQLFTLVDTAVLGNMADTTAVASVGATNTITSLVLNGITGLSTGAVIILARYIGQKDEEKMRSVIDTSLITAVGFGIIVAVLGILLTPTLLDLVKCPDDCLAGAKLYLQIYIAAAPITLLYNYGAAIMRTMGDTQRPLIYISVSGLVNVVLNIILCFCLEQKVAAVAIATVVSKIISAALVFHHLCHMEGPARVSIKKMRFDFRAFRSLIQYGIPTSISNLLYPIANLQVTPAINSFGVEAVAGNSAGNHIHAILSSFVSGFAHATTTFMGQNIGADNKDRVKKSFWYCLGFGLLITGALGSFAYLSGEIWLGLILGRSSYEAIYYGMIRMFFVTLFTFVSLTNNVLLHALQAYGYPFFGSISSIFFTLGFRIFWMQLIYPKFDTFDAVMACFTVSWTLNAIFNAIFVAIISYRYSKGKYKKI